MREDAKRKGDPERMQMWAGQAAEFARAEPAGAITLSPDEQRFVTLGTHSGDNIRIISARAAGPSEREQYEAQQ